MKLRSVQHVAPAFKINMGGIILDQALPRKEVEHVDPFLLIHHWSHRYSGGQKAFEIGVGPHPHRGFSPVTFIFKGSVHHRDTLGNSQITPAGGTQWMNSGSGLIHSERPSAEIAEKGGDFEIIQFWVNSPAGSKMDEPEYTSKTADETPGFVSPDGKSLVKVITGKQGGVTGNFLSKSELLVLRMDFQAGGSIVLDVPTSFNALLYQLDGKSRINETTDIGDKNMAIFGIDGDHVKITATDQSRMILLSGKPIGESVASYGPFVMNEEEELHKAVSDYQNGNMGKLVEEF